MGKQKNITKGDIPISTRPKGKSYLLVIGIDDYPNFQKLNNAVRDAKLFYELMTRKYQFHKDHSTLLTNEQATYNNIDNQLEHLIDITKEEDEIIIYFSGHGTYHSSREMGYWLPYDAKHDNRQTYLANTDLTSALRPIKAKHILIIADACWSGSLISKTRNTRTINRIQAIPSRWILTSGREEDVDDGPAGHHSPFAANLLNRLNDNEHSLFRLSQFASIIIEAVAANSNQIPQYEPIRNLGHMGGELIFRAKTKEQILSLPYESATLGTVKPLRRKKLQLVILGITILTVVFSGMFFIKKSLSTQGGDETTLKPSDFIDSTVVNGDNQVTKEDPKLINVSVKKKSNPVKEITDVEIKPPDDDSVKDSLITKKDTITPTPPENSRETCYTCPLNMDNVKELVYIIANTTYQKRVNVENKTYKICFPQEVLNSDRIILRSLQLFDDDGNLIKKSTNLIVPDSKCLQL